MGDEPWNVESLQISEAKRIGHGGAVVPRHSLHLRPDGRCVRHAQLDLDETQRPRRSRRELPEVVLRLAPSIDRKGHAGRGQHEIEGQVANEDVTRVKDVRIATLERQDAEEHHDRRQSRLESDQQADRPDDEHPVEREQRGIAMERFERVEPPARGRLGRDYPRCTEERPEVRCE